MQSFLKFIECIFIFPILQTNCGDERNLDKHPKLESSHKFLSCDSSSSLLLEKQANQARSEIEAILNEVPKDCSDEIIKSNYCEKVDVHFSPKHGNNSSRGQRILVMDSGFHIPAMTRYQSKVLDLVEFDERGNLESTKHTLNVNKAFYEISSKILDEKYSGLPLVLLEESLAKLNSKIKKEDRVSGFSNYGHHGTFIFTKLAEYNPRAEFVLIDDTQFRENAVSGFDLCSLVDYEDEQLKKHGEYNQFVSRQIRTLVEKYEINFINFSFSPSVNEHKRKYKNQCSKNLPNHLAHKLLQNDLKYFFEPLSNIPDVISVQAILNQGDFSSENARKENLIDCTSMTNSIRVGAYSSQDFDIPVEGSSSLKVFAKDREKTASCMDLAVNMGLNWEWSEELEPVIPTCFVHFFSKGLDRAEPPSESMLSSSCAAPIALSYLIYLKRFIMSAHISVVATPLGNREDLSPRARKVLQEADLIACEDTRRTRILLQSLEIPYKELFSYYDANEEQRAKELIERILHSHIKVALVSDAGTPAVADPGFRLIKLAHEHKIPVLSIPGPSTLAALISISGLPSDRVLFVGFLPRKKNQLLEDLEIWKGAKASILAFETPHRLCDSLQVLAEAVPHSQICIGRELTKLHEEVHVFSISEALKWAVAHTHLKGELAVMLDLSAGTVSEEDFEWAPLLKKAKFLKERGISTKDLVDFFSDSVKNKKELYKRMTLLSL